MFGIDDALIGAVAGPLIGGLLGGASSGSSQQTQTQSRDPWAPAQGWLTSNLASGKALQDQYAKNPFSDYQTAAYGNSQQLSANARSLLGNLIPQMNGFTGFDRTNPLQKPTGYNFESPTTGANAIGGTNLGMGTMGPSVSLESANQMADLQAQIAALKAAQAQVQQVAPQYFGGGGGGGGGAYRDSYSGSFQSSTRDGGSTPGSEQSGNTGAGRTNDRGGY